MDIHLLHYQWAVLLFVLLFFNSGKTQQLAYHWNKETIHQHNFNKNDELHNNILTRLDNGLSVNMQAELENSNWAKHIDTDKRESQLSVFSNHSKRIWIASTVFFATLFILLLVYHYIFLRKIRRATEQETAKLNAANQERLIALRHQMYLQRELQHRVNNNWQTMMGLLEIHLNEGQDEETSSILAALGYRVRNIASIQNFLHQASTTDCSQICDYIQHICAQFKDNNCTALPCTFNLNIKEYRFNFATLLPLGIILNELLSDSLRRAQCLNQPLDIRITFDANSPLFQMKYSDNITRSASEKSERICLYLLKSMSRQLNGYIENRTIEKEACHIFFKEKKVSNVAKMA